MKQISPDKIKNVLEEEFSHVEPSRSVWQSIANTLPDSPNRYSVRRRTYRTVLVAAILVISVFSLVAAGTDPGREMLDQIFKSFGIHVVEKTAQTEVQLEQKGVKYDFVEGTSLQGNEDKIPENMVLPAYMPGNLANSKASVYVYTTDRDIAIRWADNEQFVMVEYNEHAFGKGSTTIAYGEATDMKEVRIGDIKGFAFKDDNGWNVSWAMDGHQYGIMTNISLEEAIKVAESIK